MKNKKLLLIGPSAGSVHLQNYYNLIVDEFEEVFVISEQEVTFARGAVVDFSIKKPQTIPKKIKVIRKLIAEFNPDFIHVHQANSCALLAIKANKNRVPLVLTTWGSDVLLLPKRSRFFHWLVKFVLRNADSITADAKFMIEAIQKLDPKSKVVLVNFGIDYEDVQIPVKEKIIYSNRLHHDLYNIDTILKTFLQFSQTNPDWKLVIGANGARTEELKKTAENSGNSQIEFIGFVDSETNKDYYLKAKIWVSIPSSDGTSISLLEAMGYGCIPVASDLPANREWVKDGQNGVLVKDSLLTALNRATEMDGLKVIEMNKEIVMKLATKDVSREKFLKIYKSLLKN